MSQLRNTIRMMVRNEFAKRMLEEAERDTYSGKTVYRSSKYIDAGGWNALDTGSASPRPADKASKHDFVRWFMKVYIKRDSDLGFDDEQFHRAQAMLDAVKNDPDEFIETINKERGLLFGNARTELRTHPDPAAYLLGSYLTKMGWNLDKQNRPVTDKNKNTKNLYSRVNTLFSDPKGEEEEEEKIYDVDKNLERKVEIARMLISDPSETSTEMSVGNKVDAAMGRLTKLFGNFSEQELKDKLIRLNAAIKQGIKVYTGIFVDNMVEAFRGLPANATDAIAETALLKGLNAFAQELHIDQSLVSQSSSDYEVFKVVLLANNDEVKDKLLMLAQDDVAPDQAEELWDEIAEVAMDIFTEEYEDKQSNFNSLGVYINDIPKVKAIRKEFGTIAQRGRPAGSTKEVLAAKKSATSQSD